MQLYQWANVVTATVCALVFIIVARRTRDRISKGAMTVWAISLFWAAAGNIIIAYTNNDALVLSISRVVSPMGWTALTVYATRRLVVH